MTDTELRTAIEGALCAHFGRKLAVARFERRPFAYQTSSAIDAIGVQLDDGTRLDLLLKDLGRGGSAAARTKPAFLHAPLREIEVYRQFLAEGQFGAALCYGSVIDADNDRYWLLLEHVHGRELYQIGERSLWLAAAQWLARMHRHWMGRVEELQKSVVLLNHDAEFYRLWLTRAIEFEAQKAQPGPRRWQRLVDRYDRVIEQLVALPKTLIHGEFYASNVLVEEPKTLNSTSRGAGESSGKTDRSHLNPLSKEEGINVRVCPVDWEMAAVGPGLMDMAALTAGRWTDEERAALLSAYQNGLQECGHQHCSPAELERDLNFCRLQMAVQWLGWSPDWTPPAEHAHDWLAEAVQLAETLGL